MKQDTSFQWNHTSIEDLNLESLNVVIVGGTGGLGRAIGHLMAKLGAQVTVVGRKFREVNIPNISFIEADLSSIKVAEATSDEIMLKKPDIVLFTTGIFASTKREVTSEGLERDMAVSYLNRLVMIRKLGAQLKRKVNRFDYPRRIFLMGYPGSGKLGTINDLNQEESYGVMSAHMNTVAGNEALVLESSRRYPDVDFFGLNPGIVKTNIRDNLLGNNSWTSWIIESVIGFFTKTADQYAASIVPLLVTPDIKGRSGTFYNDRGNPLLASEGMTFEYASQYINASEQLLESKGLFK